MRRTRVNSRLPKATLVLLLWFVAICVIAAGSLLPASALHRLHYDDLKLNDKFVHFMNYLILAGLPVVSLELLGVGLACAVSMIPLGIAIEFIQKLIPGRACEIGDMIANALGVTAGVLIALLVRAALNRLASSRTQPAH